MRRVTHVIGGLLSRDPLKRISTIEKIAEHLLCKLPPEQIDYHLEIPASLPQHILTGARLFTSREEMLSVLPKGGTVAEVGTWKGGFSRLISEICRPDVFHLIDLDFSQFEPKVEGIKHQGDSSTILRTFPVGSLDWAYIDADHNYEGARRDLDAAHTALKPDGFLMINDYSNWCARSVCPYGVARASNEFVLRNNYRIEGLALNSQYLPDLLIRKPSA